MIETTMTAARKIANGPPCFLVWLTRAGSTVCIEVQAHNAADAKRQVLAELHAAEAALSAI